MKIKKSHLKELIKQAIRELKFKDKEAFKKYDKQHNLKPDTEVEIDGKKTTVGQAADVGGPSHANVKKDEPKKEPSKPKIVAPMDNPFDKKDDDDYAPDGGHLNAKQASDDIEKQTMDAAEKANKKMEIDVLNKDAEAGDGAQIDTEYGTVTWTSGDPDEDTFIATNEDGEEIEVDYADIVRFHNDNDSIMKNLNMESVKKSVVLEKFGRRFTVKEVRVWMKTLEENRYKKVYNSDARRVAWMVNHIGENLENMPKSMRKKWTKAAYGRERYLAKEFLKSKKQQMAEHRLRKLIRKVVINETRGINEKKKKL